MAGYTRQDTTGQLANGNPIDADIFNDEYDAIEGAFNASTGHNHDGTAGGGAPIESIGPSTELKVESSAVFPKNNNLIDHGKTALRWKDGYYGGTVYAEDAVINDDVSIGGDLTVTGNATIAGNLTFGDAATDTVDFQADIDSDLKPEAAGYNLGSSTQEWNNLWLDGTANVDNLTVDENGTVAGTFDVTGAVGIDGDFDINTTKFTIAAATGNTAIAGTLDVTGDTSITGNITSVGDFTTTGAINTTGGLTGDLTGDVTGNVTGDLTGDVTGNVTGNVTGDVTGNVTGDLTGNVTGDVTGGLTGNVTGNVTGDVTGDVTGALTGDVAGNVTGNLTGDVTGNLTGNVTGDVTGNVTGDLTGAVTGNVTGNLTGDVTGNVTGNVTGDLTGDVTGNLTGNVTGNVDGIIGGTTPAAVTGTTIQFGTGLTDGTTTITGFADEDDMVSNSATLIPTQQSVKAYVDSAVAGDGSGDIDVGTVDADEVDLGGGDGTGWVIYQSGTDLKFKYNGVDKFKLSSAGALEVEDNVTAYGTA